MKTKKPSSLAMGLGKLKDTISPRVKNQPPLSPKLSPWEKTRKSSVGITMRHLPKVTNGKIYDQTKVVNDS